MEVVIVKAATIKAMFEDHVYWSGSLLILGCEGSYSVCWTFVEFWKRSDICVVVNRIEILRKYVIKMTFTFFKRNNTFFLTGQFQKFSSQTADNIHHIVYLTQYVFVIIQT